MTRFMSLGAFGVTLALMLTGLAAATPAAAVPGGVEVSRDDVHYSSTFPGALFTSISDLVPGDRDQATFYLRNSASEPGFLRITLRDVAASDSDLAGALSLAVSSFAHRGAPATLLEANPCWVLLEGQVVEPGEVVRVTTSLALGDLRGKAGQGATASAALNVALSGTAAQLPPTDCGKSGTVLPVIPQPAARPAGSASTALPGASTGTEADESLTPDSPDTDLPVLNLPQLLGIDPNTWRLFEEYLVLVLIGATMIGGAVFAVVAWRRRRTDNQSETANE